MGTKVWASDAGDVPISIFDHQIQRAIDGAHLAGIGWGRFQQDMKDVDVEAGVELFIEGLQLDRSDGGLGAEVERSNSGIDGSCRLACS